jgi:spore germination protein GerM
MRTDRNKVVLAAAFILLFAGGIIGGYVYFSETSPYKPKIETAPLSESKSFDFSFVRVFYPSEDRLIMEERRIKRQDSMVAIAEAIVEEFLKGPSNMGRSYIPAGTKLLGVYYGSDGLLYLNLSDELRRNFQGDALAEFLLLKGIYESIISNVQGINDVKLVIEGKESESIGGHMSILYPLKNMLIESRITDEQ